MKARARHEEVRQALAWLARRGTKRNREGMRRYAIRARKVFGVSMTTMRPLARRLGHDHDLAAALWATGWFEARLLASFVDEPARVTPAQMERWCRDFDNWAICDSVCLHLFSRTPHAWRQVARWHDRREEFVKRAAFALMAALAVHDRRSGDEPFLLGLRRIERAATDERHFVKKAVNWALRTAGARSLRLNAEAVRVARRLADSSDATSRWIGRDALRVLTSPMTRRRLAARAAKKKNG